MTAVSDSLATVSRRQIASCLVLIPLVALLSHWLAEDHSLWAAIKIVFATLTVGLVPGALTVVAARPGSGLTVLEFFGLAVAISLGWVQLATVISLTLHISVLTVALAWAGATAVLAAGLALRRSPEPPWLVRLDVGEALIAGSLLVLATALYLKGSPFLFADDQVHAAMVRRLAFLRHPAMDNIHYLPGLVFTYPFPGIHFLMALVSRLGDIDALFVFHKLRFFWGVAAPIFLYLIARRVFEEARLAVVVVTTAVLFVFSGSFGDGPSVSWGQLAPQSNPADVALGVLLPALLAMALYFLGADERPALRFFFLGTMTVAAVVTMVQIRSIVQFLVYLGSFVAALLLVRRDRSYLLRGTALIGGTVVIVAVYLWVHRLLVPHITAAVEAQRMELLAMARSLSLAEWLSVQWSLVPAFTPLFSGWHPIMLVVSPMLLIVFRQRILMLLVGMSLVVYLLLIRVSVLGFLYAYVTHFEILSFPVRNVGLFTYLLTGACLWVVAANVARIRRRVVALGAVVAIALFLALTWSRAPRVFASTPDLLFVPVVLAYVIAFVGLRSGSLARAGPSLVAEPPGPQWKWPFILLLGLVAVLTAVPRSSPFAIGSLHEEITELEFGYSGRAYLTPTAFVDGLRCVDPGGVELRMLRADGSSDVLKARAPSCPATRRLIRWFEETVREDALVLADPTNVYALSLFIPQHVLTGLPWRSLPGRWGGGYLRGLFPPYFQAFDGTLRKYRAQPFLNDRESIEEKTAFLSAVPVTHIAVDASQRALVAAFAHGQPDLLRQVYEDGHWLVYEVVGRVGTGGRPAGAR
ncbi:MAG TPA: hypothetical protein VFO18_14260 [Methylomirabilota bacterium]|nr:hypothetical protein [Methylomirabilota bacterium]